MCAFERGREREREKERERPNMDAARISLSFWELELAAMVETGKAQAR